jgi:hypothetical protein
MVLRTFRASSALSITVIVCNKLSGYRITRKLNSATSSAHCKGRLPGANTSSFRGVRCPGSTGADTITKSPAVDGRAFGLNNHGRRKRARRCELILSQPGASFRRKGGFMISPKSFRKLKRRGRGLLKAYLKNHPKSDAELLDRLIDLCVDNRCERLEELCPEPGALDRASVRPLLERLFAEVRAEGPPAHSLASLAVPEGGTHSLEVEISNPCHAIQATHPSLKVAILAHGFELFLPLEFLCRLRSKAAEELYYRRLDPRLRDKLEELVLMFPVQLPTPSEAVSPSNLSIPAVNEKAEDTITLPTDAEVDALINAACNSADPRLAFGRLLRAADDWTRRAWTDDAGCSETTLSRWIHKMPVRRSEQGLWSALRRRLREHWSSVRGITFENL